MNERRTDAFTVSIEAARGVSHRISATTAPRHVQVAIDPSSARRSRPTGHVFRCARAPVVSLQRSGNRGVGRSGRLAGLAPGVVCEIMNDGNHGPRAGPRRYCARRVKMITVAS